VNRIRPALAVGLIGVLALAACGSDKDDSITTTPEGTTAPSTSASGDAGSTTVPSGPMTITVSAADFAESQLLMEIYAQALENNDIRVARKDPIGSRELYYKAIVANEIQLVPEYTNSLLSHVLKQADPDALPEAKNVDEQITALKAALPPELTIGAPSKAEDKDVIVCSSAVADKYSLKTLSDLSKVAGEITLGAPPEFEQRSPFGLVGFKEIYGAEFKEFVPLAYGVIPDSIESGAIDCGNIFSTQSVILTKGFIALEDDKTVVPNEAVLPLLRTEVATPAVLAVLDEVSAGLTTDILKAQLKKVEVDKKSPTIVAEEYLTSLSGS
jgi:osmoprotectant transport system substrate-binding protein